MEVAVPIAIGTSPARGAKIERSTVVDLFCFLHLPFVVIQDKNILAVYF